MVRVAGAGGGGQHGLGQCGQLARLDVQLLSLARRTFLFCLVIVHHVEIHGARDLLLGRGHGRGGGRGKEGNLGMLEVREENVTRIDPKIS